MKRFSVAVLAVTLPILAQAQTHAHMSKRATEPAVPAYRAFVDEPIANWRERNDTVARIGGWKVYAREQLPTATPTNPHMTAPEGAGARK